MNEWNARRDHREKIYISYDSTNKHCSAGDIELVEIGHSKNGVEADIFNYSIAYDRNNSEPLFYEAYPGSIVDVSQFQYTLKKAKSYGYEHIGFILDRGYFCKDNITFMDENGYEFVIMVLGLGVMLAANEVPQIAKQFGLDTSVKVHFSNAVHNTTMAFNLARAVARR